MDPQVVLNYKAMRINRNYYIFEHGLTVVRRAEARHG